MKKLTILAPVSAKAFDKKLVEGTAIEDLMGEHGALNRLMLIYEVILRRSEQTQGDFHLKELNEATVIIRDFIQNHHEKDEENEIFPLLEKWGKHVELVHTLRDQHDQGRKLVGIILSLARPSLLQENRAIEKLRFVMKSFVDMFRPHAAREDTVIYPSFKEIVSPQTYQDIKEKFEQSEHELFGDQGITGIINHIENIEERLGILNLNQFTPSIRSIDHH